VAALRLGPAPFAGPNRASHPSIANGVNGKRWRVQFEPLPPFAAATLGAAGCVVRQRAIRHSPAEACPSGQPTGRRRATTTPKRKSAALAVEAASLSGDSNGRASACAGRRNTSFSPDPVGHLFGLGEAKVCGQVSASPISALMRGRPDVLRPERQAPRRPPRAHLTGPRRSGAKVLFVVSHGAIAVKPASHRPPDARAPAIPRGLRRPSNL
jgi:hypothetical protein